MSIGSPIRPVRVPPDLGREIEVTIQRRNINTRNPPWTFSGFVIAAIQEKIRKMERSRSRPGRNGAKMKSVHLSNLTVEEENAKS